MGLSQHSSRRDQFYDQVQRGAPLPLHHADCNGVDRLSHFGRIHTNGGGASSVQETTARLSTSSPTRYTNELLYTFMDNTRDLTMTPGPPYRTALQFFPGNIDTAALAETPGKQTSTATWAANDDCYGAIVAIKSATSQPAPHGATSSTSK